jgi:hypothetical protein
MIPSLAATRPEGNLYRVGRDPDAWAWPPWEYAGEDSTFGNRYDDPRGEYRVLYACSQRVGAFIETLARYRTDPALVAAYQEIVVDPEVEECDRHEGPLVPGARAAGVGRERQPLRERRKGDRAAATIKLGRQPVSGLVGSRLGRQRVLGQLCDHVVDGGVTRRAR